MKAYHYLGSRDLLEKLPQESIHLEVNAIDAIMQWLKAHPQAKEYDDSIVLTFIIALDCKLWLNERRSEHVLCANKQNVLSAGEMGFVFEGDKLIVSSVTNQSTGYCPEPESWEAVAQALDEIDIQHPDYFTTAYLFRRCEACQSINIIKDEWFYCAVCDANLPQAWNFDS